VEFLSSQKQSGSNEGLTEVRFGVDAMCRLNLMLVYPVISNRIIISS